MEAEAEEKIDRQEVGMRRTPPEPPYSSALHHLRPSNEQEHYVCGAPEGV
jgi:hypothetical protein